MKLLLQDTTKKVFQNKEKLGLKIFAASEHWRDIVTNNLKTIVALVQLQWWHNAISLE